MAARTTPKTASDPVAIPAPPPRPAPAPSLAERRAKAEMAAGFVQAGMGLFAGKLLTEGNEWKATGEDARARPTPEEVARRFDRR